jgi:hypothetical protein
MRIKIQDDNQNWLNWGILVRAWVNGAPRPTTVAELKSQMARNSVVATVEGADERVVSVQSYVDDPTQALVIMIPTDAMLHEFDPITSGPYRLPLFYDIAYAGAARANLSAQEAQNFSLRRVGEYTVLECC